MSDVRKALPDSWRRVQLGEVCILRTGGTPSKSNPAFFGGDIKWLVSGDIHRGEIYECAGRITTEGMSESNASLLPPDSVLIALNGQGKTRGTVALLCTEATCNQSLVAMIPRDRCVLHPRFLLYQLQMRYQELRNLTGDSHRSGLSMTILDRLLVSLPPLEEQRRIAGILREQMAAVDKARAAAQARLAAIRDLPAAYLRQVFPQPGQSLPEGWRWETLSSVVDVRDGTHDTPAYVSQGIPLVTSKNLKATGLDFHDALFISEKDHNQIKVRSGVQRGDILFAMIGTIGNPVIINTDREFSIKNVALFRFENSPTYNRYLFFLLQSKVVAVQINAVAQGGIQKFVALGVLRSLQIPFPPLIEQQRIAGMLDEQMVAVNKTRTAAEAELDMINSLPAALLRRAFNGEL